METLTKIIKYEENLKKRNREEYHYLQGDEFLHISTVITIFE
jgi:hypothetical protein